MKNIQKVHLIAICGMGMGTVAGLLKSAGYEVTGSDENVYPPMSHQLRDLGISFVEGYRPSNLDHNPDLVIIGNTCKENNPEVQAAFARGIPCMSFPQALAEFFIQDRTSMVVTGTHGKTTTTSIMAWILERSGRQPSFFIGGIAKNFGASFKMGEGREFVLEGDEYNTAFFNRVPKFMHYRPTLGLINSLEFDHGDIYPTLEHIKDAFRGFVRLIPPSGFLAVCSDYPAARDVMSEARCNLQTYGLQGGAMWSATDIVSSERGTEFTVMKGQQVFGRFFMPLSGRHNVQNALGAMLLCHQVGVTPEEMRAAMASFEGVRRRQEVRGCVDDVIVLDDFAHHPTKVRETVKALKARYPTRRLWAVFEPRTASSRRDFFQKDYVASFMDAERVVIADVFRPDLIEPERLFDSRRLVSDLQSAGKMAMFHPNVDSIVEMMQQELQPGDVVLIMSNGAFEGIHDKILGMLEKRHKSQPPHEGGAAVVGFHVPINGVQDVKRSLNGNGKPVTAEVRKAV
ncbi:MAG: UDP-N-acetylmuramate:L-alanyl-gamma-D-glutamyl-meso-diaminopimelate ligase [Candidatus Xenobia bacterium]